MARELVDIWQDDYDNMMEGKGIYRDYDRDPEPEPDFDAIDTTVAHLVLTTEELNQEHQKQLKHIQELADAIKHWKYLTGRINNG